MCPFLCSGCSKHSVVLPSHDWNFNDCVRTSNEALAPGLGNKHACETVRYDYDEYYNNNNNDSDNNHTTNKNNDNYNHL